MASLNRVILLGNLTKDPDLRVTPNGTSVGTLRLAVNRRPLRGASRSEGAPDTANPTRVDSGADYFNIVVWGRIAELCQEYLRKGSPIAVDGRLQSRSWETPEGMKRSTIEIIAENVQFLSRSGTSGSSAGETKGEKVLEKPEKEEDLPEGVPF